MEFIGNSNIQKYEIKYYEYYQMFLSKEKNFLLTRRQFKLDKTRGKVDRLTKEKLNF